jgi:hypothetical protein
MSKIRPCSICGVKRFSRSLGVETPIMLDAQGPKSAPAMATIAAMPHCGSSPASG